MPQLPRRRATTIVLLLLVSGAGGAFYSHSTASERPSPQAPTPRTAAGLRSSRPAALVHPTTPAEPPTATIERADAASAAVEPSRPSVSPADSRERFNRTVFGPRPKDAATADKIALEATTTDSATPDPIVAVGRQTGGRQVARRAPAELPAILPVEPHQMPLQPTPQPPTPQPPAPLRMSERAAPQHPTSNTSIPQIVAQAPEASELPSDPIKAEELPPYKPPKLTKIGDVSTSIVPTNEGLPFNFATLTQQNAPQELSPPGEPPRTSAPFYSTPRVPDFTHRPLYFEEKALERNGRTIGVAQPVASFVHFFGTIPALPYKMGEKPPSTPMYTGNGINLPSDHATVGQRVRGVMTSAGVALGLNFALP